MINWWLLLLLIALPLAAIATSVYVLVYFQSEEDGAGENVAKGFFCLCMVTALVAVLLVPIDAANSPDPTLLHVYSDTLSTQLMWKIMMWIMMIQAVILCPFALAYYEAYDPDKINRKAQFMRAGTVVAIVFVAVLVVSVVCFTFAGQSTTYFDAYIDDIQEVTINTGSLTYNGTYVLQDFVVDVDYDVYVFGMLCMVGWVALLVYGGVGIAAYPINTLRGFMNRPPRMNSLQFAEKMAKVLDQSEALYTLALELKAKARGSISRSDSVRINVLRNEVLELENYQNQLIYTFVKVGGSPFLIYGRLVLAILSMIIALLWMIHIFVYNTFDLSPFLNVVLVQLGNWFPVLGVLGFTLFSFYMLWATFNGQIAIGLRLVFFQIYPMKKGDTLLNALLFNAFLMLITSFALIQLVARSFRDYAPLASINGLMNVYIVRLKGIGFVIAWSQFGLIIVAIASVIWLLLCPKKKQTKRNRDPRMLDLDAIR